MSDDAKAEKNKGGRPLGSMSKLAREAREAAQRTGLLPHEFLLKVARGEVVEHNVVDADTGEVTKKFVVYDAEKRIDAAKAAAPYYAPKISTVEVITGVSEDELDAIIRGAAEEAGVPLGDDEDRDGDGDNPSPHEVVTLSKEGLLAVANAFKIDAERAAAQDPPTPRERRRAQT